MGKKGSNRIPFFVLVAKETETLTESRANDKI